MGYIINCMLFQLYTSIAQNLPKICIKELGSGNTSAAGVACKALEVKWTVLIQSML